MKTIELFGLKLSIGIIIPLPWLLKIYEIHNGKKQKVNRLWQHRELSFMKRFAGILGGIAILYFAIMLIFSLSNLSYKNSYLSLDEVNKRGVFVNEVGERLGLQSGDRILAVNEESPERFSDLQKTLFISELESISLIRNDSMIKMIPEVPHVVFDNNDRNATVLDLITPICCDYPFTVNSVLVGGFAESAGLAPGDKILCINGDSIQQYYEFTNAVQKYHGDTIILGIQKAGSVRYESIEVQVGDDGKIGVLFEQVELEYNMEETTFVQAFNKGNRFIKNYFRQMKLRFLPASEIIKSNGGFITIGNIFPQKGEVLRQISYALLIYLFWTLFPTPFTEGRFLLALIVDRFVRLPRNASAWLSWSLFGLLLLIEVLLILV